MVGFLVAAVLWGLGHPKAPDAPPHPRVAATLSRVPAFAVCWLETGRFFNFTGSALLLRHPRGNILLDAGMSTHFKEEIADAPWYVRFALRGVGTLQPSLPLPAALTSAGVAPTSLKGLLITHLHLDHLGGAMDLPPTLPIWTRAEELAFAREQAARGNLLQVVPAHAELLAKRGAALTFQPIPYETFDESADLFGDGSVVLVKLTGHTPGSLGAFVNLSAGSRLFFVGDAVDERQELEKGLGKRRLLGLADADPAGARAMVGKLKQLHELLPTLSIIPAHDRSAYEAAFGGAPRCLP